MRNFIREFIDNVKRESSLEERAEILKSFKVAEKDNAIYITLNGVAFKKMEPSATVKEITDYLTEVRKVAIDYLE